MADFVQIMKGWQRICKAYTTDDDDCCKGCPVVDFHEHGCGAIFEMEDGTDWQKYADTIRAWAAEHPEPKYQSWGEWLSEIGVFQCEDGEWRFAKANEPIPADLAERLGIQPKEG